MALGLATATRNAACDAVAGRANAGGGASTIQ